ncbi:hypothetical protein DFH07DRAFT_987093 [Mycena maculata]|uniref:LysM domain-containing protein n=1 Tax=Mycena maculata TaxID=230809 RepID=A0AAD7I7J6_9AGAR|nr:hypothetical protein DFH07DRAFT_987093 [Mycena maculata]
MAPSSFLTFVLCAVAASFIGVRSTPIAHQYEVRQATSSSVLAPSASSFPPPTNVASGTIMSSCTEYYIALSGDTCATVEETFGISLAQFIVLNPKINDECTNFFAEEAYCVSTAAITGPPGNLVAGSLTPAEGCEEYYTIESGDTSASGASCSPSSPPSIRRSTRSAQICSLGRRIAWLGLWPALFEFSKYNTEGKTFPNQSLKVGKTSAILVLDKQRSGGWVQPYGAVHVVETLLILQQRARRNTFTV